MKVGIICAGIGQRSTGDFIRASARSAERLGFSSYWLPEHVLLFGAHPRSIHPYAYMSGRDPTERREDEARVAWSEPVVGMTWAAAATRTIEIGSSIIILPQRNPVILAKEIPTVDQFSGGRVAIGVGVGWCREEYEAIGADWAGRGRRMDEHMEVLRALWDHDRSDFAGETIRFKDAYMYPKPAGERRLPLLVGGESDAALTRAASLGDGWNPINLPVTAAKERIVKLKALAYEHGRQADALRIVATIFPATPVSDLVLYRDAGVTEFNLMTGEVPTQSDAIEAHLGRLADTFVKVVADW